jgi:hypothetical protein
VRTVIVATLRDLQVVDLDEAAQMVSYSMRDNPANVRAFGIESAHQRSRSLVRFFRPVLRGLHKRGTIMGAFRDKALVGRSPGMRARAPGPYVHKRRKAWRHQFPCPEGRDQISILSNSVG